MRKILLSLSCIATLYAEQMYLYEVSPIIGLKENGKAVGLYSSYAYGLQLQYNDIDFLIKPELSYIYSPNIQVYDSDERANSHLFMANGVYDLEYTDLLTPFLKAGMGYQSIRYASSVNTDSFLLDTGAGLKLHVRDQLSVKFETVVTWHDFHESNILVFAGLDFTFGNEDNTPALQPVIEEPIEAAPVDTPVYITKEDLNITQAKPNNQEVLLRDADNQIKSVTLFVPYLFRGYELDSDSITTLENYAKELRGTDNLITIIGHTDTKGRRAFNQELSLKRALIVKELFVEQGVNEKQITIEGRGESEPMTDSKNPAAQKLNKRIEIKIQSNTAIKDL